MIIKKLSLFIITIAVFSMVSLNSLALAGQKGTYNPVINPADFVQKIDNPYFPLIPGTVYVFAGADEKGVEKIVVEVTNRTREVMGVTCTVVRDREWENGELVEDKDDWFAQDIHGNVWSFGRESEHYKDGVVTTTEASWEAGINGALPGVVMKGSPLIGDIYFDEYSKGEADYKGKVVSLDESVVTSLGVYKNCMKISDMDPLEPEDAEYKYYAQGIGLVLSGEEQETMPITLVDILTPEELNIDKILEGDSDK